MIRINIQQRLHAPIDAVFEMLTQHAQYDRFPGVRASTLIRTGDKAQEPNGTGAVRRLLMNGGVSLDEEIVDFQRPTKMGYRVIASKPLPLNHLFGQIDLVEDGADTLVHWQSESLIDVPVLGRIADLLLAKRISASTDAGMRAMLDEIERLVGTVDIVERAARR